MYYSINVRATKRGGIMILPFQRQEEIIRRAKKGIIYIGQLASEFNVSEVTIRRDLKTLENENLIEMHHGGAIRYVNTAQETVMEVREQIFNDEKEKIGRYAASLVNDGELLFIDSGTTTKAMIPYLKDKKDIVLVTNGYKNMETAIQNNISDLIVLGGEVRRETYSVLGSITLDEIQLYHFDKSFIGVNGVDLKIGLTNASIDESALKKRAISQSDTTYTLVDHSKFNKKSKYHFANFSDTVIITDSIENGYENQENILLIK